MAKIKTSWLKSSFLRAGFRILRFLLLSLLLTELILQIISWIHPYIHELLLPPAHFIKDQKLGTRGDPRLKDHDANGFRNAWIPEQADIITLGDSQTWGTGVSREQAWPRILGKSTGLTVYNMAWGGYGPTHGLVLWDEAIRFKPKVVIQAFYAGNDFYDSYAHVYELHQLLELKSSDLVTLEAIKKEEGLSPLSKTAQRLFYMENEQEISSLRNILSNHSKLYGLMRALRKTFKKRSVEKLYLLNSDWEYIKREALKNPSYSMLFESGPLKTVFNCPYRFTAVNLNDIRIKEGHRMALESLRLTNDKAKKADVYFLVLLIPTKELVFKDVVYQSSRVIPESYQSIINQEEIFLHETKIYLDLHQIPYLDALPALKTELEKGNQPFSITHDDHPNSLGHQILAEMVLSKIRDKSRLA